MYRYPELIGTSTDLLRLHLTAMGHQAGIANRAAIRLLEAPSSSERHDAAMTMPAMASIVYNFVAPRHRKPNS